MKGGGLAWTSPTQRPDDIATIAAEMQSMRVMMKQVIAMSAPDMRVGLEVEHTEEAKNGLEVGRTEKAKDGLEAGWTEEAKDGLEVERAEDANDGLKVIRIEDAKDGEGNEVILL